MNAAQVMIQILQEISTLVIFDDNSKKVFAKTDDYYFAEPLVRLEALAKKLAPKIDKHFGIQKTVGSNTTEMTKVGAALIQTMRDIQDIYRKYDAHEFNPYVVVFMDCFKRTGMYYPEIFRSFRAIQFPDNAEEVLNRFVYDMRTRLNETEFKMIERKHRRAVKKNLAGLNHYFNGLFLHYPIMRVVRMDLTYLNACTKGYKYVRNPDSLKIVEYEEVRSHREKLIASLDSLFKGKLAGYSWTLKNSFVGGYNIHLIVFLIPSAALTQDCNEHTLNINPNEEIAIANKIGEKWLKITKDVGLFYHNMQGRNSSFRSCGTGLARADDKRARHLLRKAADYMIKPDLYIKYVVRKDIAQSTKVPESEVKNNDRTFGKGSLPKKDKPKD